MHDIKLIRDNPDAFDAALKRRGLPAAAQRLASIEGRRLAINRVLESWRARRKVASDKIHQAIKAKDELEAKRLKEEVAECKTSITTLEAEQKEVDQEIKTALAEIPNLPSDEVPDGVDEHGNVQRHVFGKIRNYSFAPKPHDDLGGALGHMDFEAAAKLSGARFVVLKKGLARLERAIGQFMLDLHTNEHGYTEVNPPLMVRDAVMFGTGQLPKFEEDQFQIEMYSPEQMATYADKFARQYTNGEIQRFIAEHVDELPEFSRKKDFASIESLIKEFVADEKLEVRARARTLMVEEIKRLAGDNRRWLIPTAEVPLTNLARESILDEKELPMRLTALTPCFRAEAGAAGRDTRGMIRQHQFTKVELVSITTPENSKDEHERMLSCAEEVLKRLDLHYRVMTLCAGDMGFSAQKTYDIEVWMPGQGEGGAYREISSCSVCGDFQARRMDARYRGPDGKPRFVHTLNGSGTAVGRALIAVMETYQQEDGSIAVPDVLQPYMGGAKVIEKDDRPKSNKNRTPDKHLNGTGAIVMNLQALELHIRYFLLRRHNQLMAFPNEGDKTVAENYVTNYMSLGELVDEFNGTLSDEELEKYSVDREAVRIRDALAHGRLVTRANNPPYTLWKFGPGRNGQVPVEFEKVLTDEWLKKSWLMVEAQIAKVLECFKARGYQGLG